MVASTNGSETAISIFTFSWNSITTVVPRYSLSTSRSPPCPLMRLRVMPVTPARNSAALTSASRSGRTMVVMSFMCGNIGKHRAACQEKRAQTARIAVRQDGHYAGSYADCTRNRATSAALLHHHSAAAHYTIIARARSQAVHHPQGLLQRPAPSRHDGRGDRGHRGAAARHRLRDREWLDP